MTWNLETFGALAAAQQEAGRAALHYATAFALREQIGSPVPASVREEYDANIAWARQALEDDAFERIWAEGLAMPLEEVVRLALEEEDV